ncbi:hypothetical protein IW148_003110 [Coemansia sp. RSA 1199]|nr:hypothetical protein IW148_003110 [Coemansia sp. RSA 1199]
MTTNILAPSGDPYGITGFQSLSGGQQLSLRTGSVPKQLPAGYVAPRWCPNIDILAVPEGRALRLVRLSGGHTIWRRTLSDGQSRTSPDTDKRSNTSHAIKAIAWNPNGTTIAVLHANGLLVQRDSTRGDIVHEAQTDIDDTVVAMEWVAGKIPEPAEDCVEQMVEFSLPKLSPIDRGQSPPCHVNAETEPPTAIVVTCASGSVWVCLGGIFTLPPARLPPGQLEGFVAVNARLDHDSASLFVYLANYGTAHSDIDQPSVSLCTVDTSILSSSLPLLHSLVPLSARLSALCLYLDNTLDALFAEATARHENASRSFLLRTFEGVLRDHGVDEATSPMAELSRLALTGRASEPTSQFLLAKLKSTKLNNWEHAGRQGAVALTRLIYQHSQPAVERTILAASRLLDIVHTHKSSTRDGAERTRDIIVRAIVVLGWLHARLDEYMTAVREEQQENQEFVDWALFTIDDLHWQNEGSRRLGNDDADDGLRPVRPEIEYNILFRFFRKTFGGCSDDTRGPQSLILNMLHCNNASDTGAEQFHRAYFDAVIGAAHVDALSIARPPTSTQANCKNDEKLFGFVFHSQALLDTARTNCGDDSCMSDGPPTCTEALKEVKLLMSQALEWPSHVLGDSLQWNTVPSLTCPMPLTSKDSTDLLSDMHYVASSTDPSGGTMYTATVSSSQHLVLLSTPSESNHEPNTARIELVVDVAASNSNAQQTPISVLALSFFDDDVLGILFTIDGCNEPFLGTLEYQRGSNSVVYQNSAQCVKDQTVNKLVFARLLKVAGASATAPATLVCNERKGRRCVAVVEKCGKSWWPFDMDNEEDSDEDSE